MLRLLADENFNQDIVRGLRLRQSDIDIILAQNLPIQGCSDPEVLEWAANHHRILLTHDRATMPGFAFQRLTRGEHLAGVFVISDHLSVSTVIEELLLLASCSEQNEWYGQVIWLPL